jgi:hypothetical protein
VDYRMDFSALEWKTLMPGLRCKTWRCGGRQLRLAEYGAGMEPHWCEKGHIGMVLEGRFEIRFDRGIEVYGPGDGVFIPPGPEHRHMARALSPTVLAIFVEDV